MNIQELNSYNLADAVKFNDQLNPRIWGTDEHLHAKVRERLLDIAQDFREFLGVKDLDLQDITISGSNAAYTYTPNSDIDLHLVVRMPDNEVYRELFDAKKFQYNEQHNIKIGGYDVELYVQDADQPHISQGIYSVINNDWIQVPRRVKAVVDDTATQNKFETVSHQIEKAVASGSLSRITQLSNKIKKMRQTGLESHGEFGPENLAFKMLRSQGKIKQLYDARNAAKDQALSLKEQPKKPFINGFKDQLAEVGLTPDGVNPTTCMFLNEQDPTSDEDILKNFIEFCVDQLQIERLPTIKLRKDPQWSVVNGTFGRYIDDQHLLEVAWGQRHIMDILRTVAHELTHAHQHERETVPSDAGETGSEYENEANAQAGVLMRDYAGLHPDFFAQGDNALTIESQLDESLKTAAGATAVITCLLAGGGLSGCASAPQQTTQQILRTTQDVGRVSMAARNITRAGSEAEARSEIRNVLQAGAGGYGSEGAANTSNILRIWRKLQPTPPVPPEAEPPRYGPAEPRQRMRQNESASGYIPTRAQARDPRHSMALTVDIKPGQVGKEANKLKLKTNKQGQPQVARANGLFEKLALELLQFKKKGTLVENEEQLDEVKMSPSALQQWANSDAAQGIRSGFEAELIFRDTVNDNDDDDEMEPDYDYDERASSVDGVIDFFRGGDYGDLSSREAEQLNDGLNEKYYEWYDERMMDAFRDEAEDLVRAVIQEEDWELDNEIQKQLELAQVPEDEFNAVIQAGERAPRFTSTKEQQAYAEANPLYTKYLDAQTEAEDLLDTLVEDSVRAQDKYYDAALDDYRENFQIDDDSDFFESIGLTYMSDIAAEYSLSWPYLTGSGGGNNGGSREWGEIGDSLERTVGMPVKVSGNYHSTTRKEGQWIVEPDSSLSADDRQDMGLEIVSPPMPLLQALEQLQAVTDWANSSEGNAYTNQSTGLHMGVSVPYKGGDVDYVKLILFLGDEYVLQSFGREANSYTKSAMSKFRENIKAGRADPAGAMALMKSNLIEFAYREIQKGVGTGKYTSAHIQDGYIEFRSAGGDWLAEESADPQKLSSTMLRYARAMQIAASPAEERQEYAKKLYKLISPEGDGQLALFSQFSAGQIDKEQLKKQWAEKALGTERKMNQRWKLYDKTTGEPVPGFEFNNYTQDDAWKRVAEKLGMSVSNVQGAYELRNMSEDQQWEVYNVDTGETLEVVTAKTRGEAADAVFDKYANQGIGFNVRPYQDPATMTPRAKLAKRIAEPKAEQPVLQNYEVVDQRDVNLRVVGRFQAQSNNVAEKYSLWLKTNNLPDDTEDYGYRKGAVTSAEAEPNVSQNFNQPQDATEIPRNWEFVNRINGQVIHNMTNASYNQANLVQDNLETRYPDADIFLRSVERSTR